MRVLHVLHTSLPFICGYSIRSDYILRFQIEQGMQPAVVTSAQHPNGDTLHEDLGATSYWRTPALRGTPRRGVREMRLMQLLQGRIETAIREWRPSLIHAHSPALVGLPALLEARRHRIPIVYEVRDLWENASVDRGKFSSRSPQYLMARTLESMVLRQADAVVTICEKLGEELGPRSRDAKRVFVVGNGVDAETFSPRPKNEQLLARWNLQGKKVIGYIGTFQPYEGLETLIEAMHAISAAEPQAHLLITGSGGEEQRLRAQVKASKLEDRVTFTGRVPHQEVVELYTLSDLLVYPRILTRTTALTTPLKPLEAMAMARPVLVSDAPAMLELVQAGKTGVTFQAGDSKDLAVQALKVLQSLELQQQLGLAGREWIEKERQWPYLVSKYQGIYDLVLSGKAH